MSTSEHEQFDRWLDALAQGTPPPIDDEEAVASREHAALRVQQWARRLEEQAARPASASSWATFTARHPEADTIIRTRAAQSGQAPRSRGHSLSRRVNDVASVLLAAGILLALAAGIWRAPGIGWGFQRDGTGEQEPVPLVSQAIATPPLLNGVDLPTPDECTVEPLTVDEVIWYIRDPGHAGNSSHPDIAATPIDFPDPATPPATNPPHGPASADDLAGMVATQRMWMACALADSPFQVWALRDPAVLGVELRYAFPPLTGEDEARDILAALEREEPRVHGQSIWFSLGTTCTDIALISDDPAGSWGVTYDVLDRNGAPQRIGTYVVAWTGYDEDGHLTRTQPSVSPEEMYQHRSGFIFVWNVARSMWLIEQVPGCG